MLIANAPCSWGVTRPTGNAVGWEQYLDEVAGAGYRGTELGPFGFLPQDRSVLRHELESRGLKLVGATHVHTFGDRSSAPRLMETIRQLAPLLDSAGARDLVIMDESECYPAGGEGVLDAEGWAGLATTVREAQALIEEEFGLKASFHPHIGTAVETEAQIDRLLADTAIDLCFDTGHHAVWHDDVLGYMRKVRGRICYMHLKNVDDAVRQRVRAGTLSVAESYGAGVMAPLPDGALDIRLIMAFLEESGFAGPLVVEQDVSDNATETPLELSRRNLEYLAGIA